jgi:hypothetical protein
MSRLTTSLAPVLLLAGCLAWLGPWLDDTPTRTYSSYGYTAPDQVRTAVAESEAADQAHCEALYGPHAVALQLPDGQHRCVDKRGRRLSAHSVISLKH